MKTPKFRIGTKVKVRNSYSYTFTEIIAIEQYEHGEIKYITNGINGKIQEQYVEKPTDYELGTYY